MTAADEDTAVVADVLPGQSHDAPHLPRMLDRTLDRVPVVDEAVGDRGLDGDRLREACLDRAVNPNIPPKANRDPERWSWYAEGYVERNRVEAPAVAASHMPDEFYELVAHHLPPEPPRVGPRGGRPWIGHPRAGRSSTPTRRVVRNDGSGGTATGPGTGGGLHYRPFGPPPEVARCPTRHSTRPFSWVLPRTRAGDPAARDELLRVARARLESLTEKMLRKFPTVARWAVAGDVFSGAAVRLLRALESMPASDTRAFLNPSATMIRRELIDLTRRFQRPHGVGTNHDSVPPGGPVPDPSAPTEDRADLGRWAALHTAVEQLSVEEREAFGLVLYHGWTQAQIAELFGVDERTVRRRLVRAADALHAALGGEPAVRRNAGRPRPSMRRALSNRRARV